MKTHMAVQARGMLGAMIIGAALAGRVFGDGLAGEYLVSDEWRRLLAYYSPVSCPAFLTEANYFSIRGAGALSLDGPSRLFEVGSVLPIGLYQSAGLTAIIENGKDIAAGGYVDASGRYYASDRTTNNNNCLFMGSYAINPVHRLSVGANLNFIYQENFDDPTFNVGLDLGASYRLTRHPLLGDHTFGVAYQNFLASKIAIGDAPSYAEQIRTILHSTYAERRVESTIEFDITDIAADPADFVQGQDPSIEWGMTAQIGTWLLRVVKAHAFLGLHGNSEGAQVDAWGLAGGVNAPMANNGRDLNVEYQFRDEVDQSLMATHSIHFRVDIGMHREEIYARKMARLANVLPNELYNQALKLYYEGKYWEAYFIFGQILARFPDFFKNDMVTYYRGSCLEEMDMRARSLATYERLKEEYAKSTAISLADLGIMRIAYRNDDRLTVGRQFNLLTAEHVIDSLKYHAYYLMGQVNMREDQQEKAMQLFDMVPETHPDYVFAQHSKGVACIAELNLERAMRAFENCLQAQVKTEAQKEVYARSCLFLGYLFYEENSLSKAVTALRMVPQGSYYYEDALLGLGWCAIKARQWGDCINAGSMLARTSDKEILQYEGALLKAYALLMQKNYDAGLNELQAIADGLQQFEGPSQDALATERHEYQRVRISYDYLASQARELSLVEQSSATLLSADSLHAEQQAMARKLRAFEKFTDEFERRHFFARGVDKLREDVDYALAVLGKLSGRSDAERVKKKLIKKTEDLDDEIEKLEQEMQKIDGEEEQ
ncbi:MAG: tetratricopeptide repeat protein [Chitinivibrionales bacterium]|nr:tetratricopeptide repeat protein [Chitinivibrionales bacterium]MBD3394426.1 tetratricopeptide repeat protein [Chitinivibrionales bacterium]